MPLRHTIIYVNMRGGADGLTLLAPADDAYYQLKRTPAATGGTRIENMAPNMPLTGSLSGTTWWLPAAMAPLEPVYSVSKDLAIVPAVGMVEGNKSHFVAQDLLEFGNPPALQMSGQGPITDGFMARLLKFNSFNSSPVLRGLVASKLASTAFLEAPTSLAIGNVQDFYFPSGTPGQIGGLMSGATDAMHEATALGPLNGPAAPLRTASRTSFDSIAYLDGVGFYGDPGVSGISALGNAAGQYPDNEVGRQFQRACALILADDPPEVIEIDIGGWDHHDNMQPNSPGGIMWQKMDIFARALATLHGDLKAAPYPHAAGENWMDRVTVISVSEFGRRIAESDSKGTDHGKAGTMFVMGGSHVDGGKVYDPLWTGLLNAEDFEGDVTVQVDQRAVFAELFTGLMQLSNADSVYFNNFTSFATGWGPYPLNFIV